MIRVIAIIILLIQSVVAFPSLFDFGSSYYTIETRYFNIIYSDASRESAQILADFADETYEKINSILQTKHNERIVVVITADIKTANGFNINLPYTKILLYAYPPNPDSSLGNYRDWLYELFVHELTHAISLNIRADYLEVIRFLFGNWVSPALAMPWSMIEGVTVSFESLEGFGRGNNPLILHELKQDILENRFKDVNQASGAYDLYPYSSIFYHYGGYFSLYLQKKYGLKRYRELWHNMGANLTLIFDQSFYYTYGIGLERAWEDYREALVAEITAEGLPQVNPNLLSKDFIRVGAWVGYRDKIYYTDSFSSSLRCLDITEKTDQRISEEDNLIETLSVSQDGNRLLISRKAIDSGLPKELMQIYDLKKRQVITNIRSDYREASFFESGNGHFQSGFIAIKIRGHYTDLVFCNDGKETTLYRGHDLLYFAKPCQLDSNRIVFLIKENGTNKIGLYHLHSRETTIFETGLSHIRDVTVTEGQILFSYNNGLGWNKLAVLDTVRNTLSIQSDNISGGVFSPYRYGQKIVYLGRFSEGMRWMEFPPLALKSIPFKTVRWTGGSETPLVRKSFIEKTYNPLPYYLPRFWVPSATLGNLYPMDAFGFMTVLRDPLEDNTFTIDLKYNYAVSFADYSVRWDNNSLPLYFSAVASDSISYNAASSNYNIRTQSAQAALNYSQIFLPVQNTFYFGMHYSYYHYSMNTTTNGVVSPYDWGYLSQSTAVGLYVGFGNLIKNPSLFDYEGMQIILYGDYQFDQRVIKTEFSWRWYPDFFPLHIHLYGAFSTATNLNFQSQNFAFFNNRYPVFKEYRNILNASWYYLGGDLSMGVFNLEIQEGILPIPIYANRIYLKAGYRFGYLENKAVPVVADSYYHSVYARIQTDLTLLYKTLKLTAYCELQYRLNFYGFGIDYGLYYSIPSL